MVINSSALLAGLLGEPDADRYFQAIDAVPSRTISAGSLLELYLVLEDRLGPLGGDQLDLFLLEADIKVIPFDRASGHRAAGVSPIRQGAASGAAHLWRLHVVRALEGDGRAVALQGRRLHEDRRGASARLAPRQS